MMTLSRIGTNWKRIAFETAMCGILCVISNVIVESGAGAFIFIVAYTAGYGMMLHHVKQGAEIRPYIIGNCPHCYKEFLGKPKQPIGKLPRGIQPPKLSIITEKNDGPSS